MRVAGWGLLQETRVLILIVKASVSFVKNMYFPTDLLWAADVFPVVYLTHL